MAVSQAVAQATSDAAPRDVETLYDTFGAQTRRANPSDAEVAWRKKAGDVDRQSWPGEIVLKEIEPTLGQFFGALQGRGFDDEQITSLFAENFRGTRIGEIRQMRSDSRVLRWGQWQRSEKSGRWIDTHSRKIGNGVSSSTGKSFEPSITSIASRLWTMARLGV